MPDHLLRRIRKVTAERNTTFRALVIEAVERILDAPPRPFRLRDASVGPRRKGASVVSAEEINRAIDGQRERPFQP